MEQITKRLKIYYRYDGKSRTRRPYIRVSGKYLAKMGFNIGEGISVTVTKSCILITKRKASE